MKKEKVIVYARVSTDHDEQKTSIESQQDIDPDFLKDNNYELLKLYVDKGESATSANRKSFLDMLYDSGLDWKRGDGQEILFETNDQRDPLFDWIIVKDVSRFTRNIDTINTMKKLVEKGVNINFVDSGFTTKFEDWQMRVTMYLMFAQEESLNTSRKLRNAYLKRAKKGKFHMSVNLLGYGRDKKTKEYYIKEDEAVIVRKIFDYFTIDKIGSYEIGDLLNEQGYTTKQGRRWTGSSVLRVLNNEKFKGQVIQNRYSTTGITGSNKRVINPRDEWVIHDDALPKIVSVEQFDEAQKIMASRTHLTTNQKRGSNKRQVRGKKVIKNIFHKKIICGRCGADYTRESATKKRKTGLVKEYYYGCRNRRNKQRKIEKCMSRGISHDVLVRELLKIGEKMNLIDLDDEALAMEMLALKDKLNQVDKLIEDSDLEKNKIDDKITDIDQQISNLFNTLSGGVSPNIVKMTHDKIAELENEQKQLEASKINFDVIELENKKKMYNNKFDEIVKLSKKTSYTFDEILEQIHEIEIFTDNKVIVKFKVPTLRMEDDTKRLVYYMFER